MALIGMAVYSTEENKKDDCLEKTLESLADTVDFTRHRIMLSINGNTNETRGLMIDYNWMIEEVIYNESNIGTAHAINKTWQLRRPDEHCIKMDDDIVINNSDWIDEMEWAIYKDPTIGQIGLKRKDCWEWPGHESEDYKSELKLLPHIPGEPWVIVEKAKHIIGSCVMHSSALLDKVGYLYQPSLYGYDDVIMSHRAHLAGYYSCFLPHINIDHIDPGQTPYQDWKHKHSGEQTQTVIDLVHEMYAGTKPIYYNPFEKAEA